LISNCQQLIDCVSILDLQRLLAALASYTTETLARGGRMAVM